MDSGTSPITRSILGPSCPDRNRAASTVPAWLSNGAPPGPFAREFPVDGGAVAVDAALPSMNFAA